MRVPWWRTIVVVALAALAVGCGGSGAAQERLPHIVMVVVDTLRADRLGAYGNTRGLTPFLDSLARRAHVVARSYAQAPWTNPSVASIFTSRYITQHGVVDFGSVLGAGETTLAEVLHDAGYATGGFSSNGLISPQAGFGQGFDQYNAYMIWDAGERFRRPAKRADEITAAALRWLDKVKRDRSVFLYVHYMEPHAPYAAPPEMLAHVRGPTRPPLDMDRVNRSLIGANVFGATPPVLDDIRDTYDAEVMAVDEGIRRLLDALAQRGIGDDALLVVTADHGDEFMDHGGMSHGKTLYGEVMHVPLIIRTPGQTGSRTIKRVVSSVDIAPTLLDQIGLAIPARFEGVSFARELSAPELGTRVRRLFARLWDERPAATAFSELVPFSAGNHPKVWPQNAVVVGYDKVITWSDGHSDFYALADDPQEQRPNRLVAADRDALVAMRDKLRERLRRDGGAAERHTIDPQTKDALRSLGYTH